MIDHPQAVVKAIDFITYSCSGWACVSAYVNHYSTLFALGIAFCSLLVSLIYKHLNYRNETRKLDRMFGQED
jgi:hypothetical protein|tara:strand:+ start:1278 stop:1493 length:216 start_codon:yes stop_codon:yes gene_type:complete